MSHHVLNRDLGVAASSRRQVISRFYEVRGQHREWARLWLTDDGCLSILSDFGEFGYWWTHPGCKFREFLTKCDDDYLLRKFAQGEREIDCVATRKAVQELIIGYRRDGIIDRSTARTEYDRAEAVDWANVLELNDWLNETELPDSWESIHSESLIRHDFPGALRGFMRQLWPLFVQQLKEELRASAVTAATDVDGAQSIE